MKNNILSVGIAFLVFIFVFTGMVISSNEAPPLPDIEVRESVVTILTNQDPENDELWEEKTELLKEKYDAEVELIMTSFGDKPYRLAELVMAGDPPDLYWFTSNVDYPVLSINNLVEPVDRYADLDEPIWDSVRDEMKMLTWEGRPQQLVTGTNSPFVIFYNPKIFNDFGLDTPRDYYERGEWNWNTFRRLAEDLTLDLSGDGDIDLWGLYLHPIQGIRLFATTGKRIIEVEPEEKIVYNNLRDPDIARVMDFMYELGADNLIYPGDRDHIELFKEGNLAMWSRQYNRAWIREDLNEMYRDGELSFAPYPKDPEADEHYLHFGSYGYAIPAGANNPEGGVAWVAIERYFGERKDIQEKQDKRIREEYGISQEDLDFIEQYREDSVPNFENSRVLRFGGYSEGRLTHRMLNARKPWVVFREEQYPEVQSAIDMIIEDIQ